MRHHSQEFGSIDRRLAETAARPRMSVQSLMRSRDRTYEGARLQDGEDPFSTNKVTGWSLNMPIIGTCAPTVLCADTCYFAKGPSTWPASRKKQYRLMNSTIDDPVAVANLIVRVAKRKKMTFIRWNGGGDLIESSIDCIDSVAVSLPDVPQWIVTRRPEIASRIVPRKNVFVHLSVDHSSWDRYEKMHSLAPAELQWFRSYQCAPGEYPPSADVAPVIFRNNYDLAGTASTGANECPLNLSESIVRVCESCRRCFNGDACK